MTTATVTISHPDVNSGVAVRVLCNKVFVSGKRSLTKKPYVVQSGNPSTVQTHSYENLTFNVQGIKFTGSSGTFTWAHLLALYKSKYTGSNYITLNVSYGKPSALVNLVGLQGVTNIKCTLEDFDFPIDATDSDEGYLPVGSMKLIETA